MNLVSLIRLLSHFINHLLSILGELINPKEYFQLSDYPSFLKSSVAAVAAQPSLHSPSAPSSATTAAPHLTHAQAGESEVDLVCTEPSAMDTGTATMSGTTSTMSGVMSGMGGANPAVGGVSSAFSSVDSSKDLVTPNLYGPPAVGKAVASSTPAAARSLDFTGSNGSQQYQPGLSVGVAEKGKG